MFSHIFIGVTDFDRALAFYRLQMRVDGNREWFWAIRPMSDEQLIAAAEWRKCGLGFRMTRLSQDNEDLLVRLGITPDFLERSIAQ